MKKIVGVVYDANTVRFEDLLTVPRIGVLAALLIIKNREENGGKITSIQQLVGIPTVSSKKIEILKEYLKFEDTLEKAVTEAKEVTAAIDEVVVETSAQKAKADDTLLNELTEITGSDFLEKEVEPVVEVDDEADCMLSEEEFEKQEAEKEAEAKKLSVLDDLASEDALSDLL